MQCLDCQTWYLDPRPDETALSIIYPPNYYIYAAQSSGPARKGLWSTLAGTLFKMRIKPIEQHIQLGRETRWLEVGCGNGNVLEALQEIYGIQAEGLDISKAAADNCQQKGFKAHCGRFEEFDAQTLGWFDIVHSSHLIEHLNSPREYVEKVFELLKPGGLCVFATPNTNAVEATWFGPNWGGLHVPRHWALLNHDNVRTLVEGAGFQFLGTKFSTNGAFWSWTMHAYLVRKGMRAIADRLFPSDHRFTSSSIFNIFRLGAFTLVDMLVLILTGRSSNMLIIARKPGGNHGK